MPAYFDTGFSVREPMWHGGGLVLDEYPEDWNDARDKAGLMWEPMALTPTYIIPADKVDSIDLDSLPEGYEKRDDGSLLVPDPRHLIIVRDDTFQTLGATSDTFKLIYHRQMGELLEALLEVAGGKLKFERPVRAARSRASRSGRSATSTSRSRRRATRASRCPSSASSTTTTAPAPARASTRRSESSAGTPSRWRAPTATGAATRL